jgi:hypothetical protein
MCPLRIVHLEDDPNDAELIKAALDAERVASELVRVDTQVAFRTSLEQAWHRSYSGRLHAAIV